MSAAFAAVNDFEDEEPTVPERELPEHQCPLCSGTANFLGALNHREWFRCRSCGCEYTRYTEVTS
jgi:hypothetical protein